MQVSAIAKRQIEDRSAAKVAVTGKADHTIRLAIQAGIGAEGFRIENEPGGAIRIVGNDERGLLYGVGKFLRVSGYAGGLFTPGAWRGASAPEKPVRGIYFATHFHNFYHDAPVAQIERYVEDLALWGINTFTVWFDLHHYRGIDDPDAQRMIARLKAVLGAAKRIGLSAGLLFLANEAYANSPEELRADYTAGHDGYSQAPGGHYHVELCPNKPGGRELLLKWATERLEAFADIMPDYLWLWPYDQGGCTCSRCAPWGANGFLSIAEPTARLYRRYNPRGKVILSTWFFDHFIQGEWAGLNKAFREKQPDWVDYLMADDYGDKFPDYPLRHGVPGGLPLLSFPEISMYRTSNWGGFGANPLPRHFQDIWDASGKHLSGGFPYSEGVFDDINKAVVAQLQWQENREALDVLREYIAFEYSPGVVDDVTAAVDILERNVHHQTGQRDGLYHVDMPESADTDKAWARLESADQRLSPHVRKTWRWRILYLRGLIDAELAANDFRITERCEEAFEELTGIYHAGQAALCVAPPTRAALGAGRGQ